MVVDIRMVSAGLAALAAVETVGLEELHRTVLPIMWAMGLMDQLI